jgi:hypothetical protein
MIEIASARNAWLAQNVLHSDAAIGCETDTKPRNPASDHHSARGDRTSPVKPPLLERCDIAAAEVERQADEFLKMTPVNRQET